MIIYEKMGEIPSLVKLYMKVLDIGEDYLQFQVFALHLITMGEKKSSSHWLKDREVRMRVELRLLERPHVGRKAHQA